MPIRGPVVVTDTYLEFNKGDGTRRINFSDIQGTNWNAQRIERARAAIQSILDGRILRSGLSIDDPAFMVDPGLPWFFWDGLDLVSRPVAVTVEATGGSPPIRLTFTSLRMG